MDLDIYSNLLSQYVANPENDLINFYLGAEYQALGHTAAAISFYLRAAERTEDLLLRYECMLKCSMCFEMQGSRGESVIGLLQHAVALLPERPEAYFFLSRYYERAKRWFESYMIASIGAKVTTEAGNLLKTDSEYPGYYGLLFEKAVSGWWCGLCSESLEILKDLSINYIMDDPHKTAVANNLKNLGGWKSADQFSSFLKSKPQELDSSEKNLQLYNKIDFNKMKFKFDGLENIRRNYSEAFQDILVLTLLGGKRDGYYLEIGAGFPFYGNNTYLLEQYFNWKGVSIDINRESIERYFQDRNNHAIVKDATQVDYKKLLTDIAAPNIIDYLQLDCDPSEVTYDILTKIPFDDYLFKIITYEHDDYNDVSKSYKPSSRKYLEKMGYILLISDVSVNGKDSFEDWWIHPYIATDKNMILKDVRPTIKTAKNIFVKN